MTETEWEALWTQSEAYAFTSMHYTEYEEIRKAVRLPDADAVLLAVPDPDREGTVRLFWAADTPAPLLRAAENFSEAVYTEFVPASFVEPLSRAGFQPESCFRDYFCRDLSGAPDELPDGFFFLRPENAEEASTLTMACRWQSRGFHGEKPAFFLDWLAEPENAVLGLREEKNLAGVICLSTYEARGGKMLWLREIAVAPPFQSRGYGRKLIRGAFCWGRRQGAVQAFLAADTLNARAIHLYESCGFCADEQSGQLNMLRPQKAAE